MSSLNQHIVSHDMEISRSVINNPLRWPHNGHDGVSNHQPHHCLLNRLSRRTSKKTSKLRVTGLCAGNSPGTGEFPAQKASNAENVSIWWRHYAMRSLETVTSQEPQDFSNHKIVLKRIQANLTTKIDLLLKYHNASVPFPTMHCVHIS